MIRENILDSLLEIKPDTDFYFKYADKWKFPDGYVHDSKVYSPNVVLYYKEHPIAIFNYTNKPFKKSISINFIQGIRQFGKVDLKYLKKPFYETIMDSFLIAAAPLIEKGIEIKFERSSSKNVLAFITDIKKFTELLERNNYMIAKNKERMVRKDQDPRIVKTLAINNIDLKFENEFLERQINSFKSIVKINSSVRERYFDREGNLNFNKERVKSIVSRFVRKPIPAKKTGFSFKKLFKIRK